MDKLVDASTCQLLVVFMIGSIEVMLQEWRDSDRVGILKEYLRKPKLVAYRVASLFNAFHNAGIQVDKAVYDDYLAI